MFKDFSLGSEIFSKLPDLFLSKEIFSSLPEFFSGFKDISQIQIKLQKFVLSVGDFSKGSQEFFQVQGLRRSLPSSKNFLLVAEKFFSLGIFLQVSQKPFAGFFPNLDEFLSPILNFFEATKNFPRLRNFFHDFFKGFKKFFFTSRIFFLLQKCLSSLENLIMGFSRIYGIF